MPHVERAQVPFEWPEGIGDRDWDHSGFEELNAEAATKRQAKLERRDKIRNHEWDHSGFEGIYNDTPKQQDRRAQEQGWHDEQLLHTNFSGMNVQERYALAPHTEHMPLLIKQEFRASSCKAPSCSMLIGVQVANGANEAVHESQI